MLTPSIYNIDAWEHCELLYITRKDTIELQNNVPAFCEMKLKLDEGTQISSNRQLTSAISATAEKRYTDFIECYREFPDRYRSILSRLIRASIKIPLAV